MLTDPESIFSQGDPLADAVTVDWQHADSETRVLLMQGMRHGLASISHAPASFRAFLKDAELAGASADLASCHRAAEYYLVVGPLWVSLSQGPGALVHTYKHPGIAHTLMRTGRLSGDMAARRLLETSVWNLQLLKQDGLTVGGSGYCHTLQVRLMHARVRSGLQVANRTAPTSCPIDQREMVHTWLGFSVVALSVLQRAGLECSEETLADIFNFWHLVGRLLGIHEQLLAQMQTPAMAQRMLEQIHADSAEPDANSLALMRALSEALSLRLSPALKLPQEVTLLLIHALVRLFHGDELADRLGLRPNWTHALLPMMFDANRYRQQRADQDPAFRASVIAQSRQAIGTVEANLQGTAAYQIPAQA